jgi:tetratricopeptide (TPR) repeat protein
MHDCNNKYVVVEDALAERTPRMWVISAIADTLQAARAILNVDTEPQQVPKSAYSGEQISRTLVMRRGKSGKVPQPGSIYRLEATGKTEAVSPVETAEGAGKPELSRLWENHLLHQAGVATTDRDAYAEINMLGFLGSSALSSGDYAKAEGLFKELLALAHRINHPPSLVKAYGSLGAAKVQMGDYQEAITLLNEALAIARQDNLVDEEGPTLTNLAEAYARAGDGERAVARHMERRVVAKRTGDRRAFALSTGNIGITRFEMGNYQEALQFLQVAVHEFRTMRMSSELARTLAYEGVTYQALNDIPNAIDTYELHLTFCGNIGDFTTAGSSYVNLSGILYRDGKRDEAVRVATEGLERLQHLGSPEAAQLQKNLAIW